MSKKKALSLSEKISDLLTAKPKLVTSDDENEETRARIVDDGLDSDDFDLLPTSSSIRKKNIDLLENIDKRYSGKKVSQKQIFGDSDDSENESEEKSEDQDSEEFDSEDESAINEFKNKIKTNDNDESKEIESNNESGDEDSEEFDSEDESVINEFKNKIKTNDDDESEEMESEDESNKSGDEDSEKDVSKCSGDGSDDEEDDDDNEDEDDADGISLEEFEQSFDVSNPLLRNRNGIQTVSSSNAESQLEKGAAVREQLKLWESLLETRIKFQKCLLTSNALPQLEQFKELESDKEFKSGAKDIQSKLCGLLNNLLDLQSNLLNNFSETKGKSMLVEQDSDEEILSDTEEEDEKEKNQEEDAPSSKKMKLSDFQKFEKVIADNHKSYKDYRNSVIQKWSDKTRVASGQIMKNNCDQPIVKQIEYILSNKAKLIKRTQLKRSDYEIVGKTSQSVDENDGRAVQEYDPEIFDDDDFYHQLLRDLIEYKSADITDPIQLSKQWIQLQSMRSKMKRKIDTRATKGRRLRYNVHQKLVNFMAPITTMDTWTDAAKNELYSSMFGKIKGSSS